MSPWPYTNPGPFAASAIERVAELCARLKLTTVADVLPHLAQKAITDDISLTEFLESVLKAEQAARLSRQLMRDIHAATPMTWS